MSTAQRRPDQVAADYARHRAEAVETQRRISALSATVTSAQGLVTVTVDARSEITSLTFNSQQYRRMAAAELAHVVLDTVKRARASVLQQMTEVMPAARLAGMALPDVLAGRVDIERMLPERLEFGTPPLTPGRG
ncbi:YbaB/EbfC DNA-binding family protein [Krasilnikovia cinnamomea]|uniref:YbaB/EbfC DNA-binding family protein n=1 Tax=Krasilnikovia cinnamomea TaxID=349313 RepID=A0A4Q7ZQS8_9ACTN|nr:YbaB/EbfC family nucleoid-associated protein [Krasilnikovia cinnamomea]RZU53467.1 YbaB/EbfC DNA-binding family protein [Krasilnikovia cinnamomea]